MAQNDTIEENLKELLDKKSREERKANGRLVAVIVALLVIFLAIYHAWIRKSAVLAGVLVPALIMISYGGWVVILAKRDKQKRAMFEKHLEEIARQNKIKKRQKNNREEIDAAAVIKENESFSNAGTLTKLHYEHETAAGRSKDCKSKAKPAGTAALIPQTNINDINTYFDSKNGKHRKQLLRQDDNSSGSHDNGSCSSSSSTRSTRSSRNHHSSHHRKKELQSKRPSLRNKLFRKNDSATAIIVKSEGPPTVMDLPKKKLLQRFYHAKRRSSAL